MSKSFEVIAEDGKARVGKLKTSHGTFETPFFMPVATKGAVRLICPEDLEEMGAQSLISNAFLLFLRPGIDVIKKHKGLHNFMHWHKCIFTDCGGFQILSFKDGFINKITKEGIKFKSPYDGKVHLLTPKKIMEIEHEIGSDVAMALDHMPLYGSSKEEVALAVKHTNEWAEICLEEHKKINKKGQLLFGIIQGGVFEDLRKKSAESISKMDFDGFAIGGLCIGETKKETYKMLDVVLPIIPKNKPRYLMGVGSPEDLVECISKGVDIFDSVYPTRNGRHGQVLTSKGYVSIDQTKYKEDMTKLDENCDCKMCRKFTKSYIHHLIKRKEMLGPRIVSYHNVYFLQNLTKKIREAIKEDRFEEFKNEFLKNYKKK